jgi:hypothetical protein
VAVITPLHEPVRELLALRLRADETPPPDLANLTSVAVHNFPIAAWPLLLGVVGAHQHELLRHVADAVLASCIGINTLLVGAAIGAYGPALLRYIPQLPLEWAALAVGASAWLLLRRKPITVTQGLAVAAATLGVVIGAATIETLAVPHEPSPRRVEARAPVKSQGGLGCRPVDTAAGPTIRELKHETSGHGCPGGGKQ